MKNIIKLDETIELDDLEIKIIGFLNRINKIYAEGAESDESCFERFALISSGIGLLSAFELIGKDSFIDRTESEPGGGTSKKDTFLVQQEVIQDAVKVRERMIEAMYTKQTVPIKEGAGTKYDTVTFIGAFNGINVFLVLDAEGKKLADLENNPNWPVVEKILREELSATTYEIR